MVDPEVLHPESLLPPGAETQGGEADGPDVAPGLLWQRILLCFLPGAASEARM